MDNRYLGNPYLPENEFVPDGEPHVFDGRVYLYGSHDRAGGTGFCLEDYVCYSAPETDLSQWTYEGVIYKKSQDPMNHDEAHMMFAPDLCKGTDERYYLYYALDMTGMISVAVSDTPSGCFAFYGHIQNPDGSIYDKEFPYDPAVLFEDSEHIYLYYGFSFQFPIPGVKEGSVGGMMVRLGQDMKTVISEPCIVLPSARDAGATGFEGHAFFEAPSIRKIGDSYYLIYCSEHSDELCYAVSRYPDREFRFGGVIVSNADFGYQGNTKAVTYYGNNHGGLLCAEGNWYIFYHRHTHGTQFSRQGCAERVTIEENGMIAQVPVTSQGLYAQAIPGSGLHPASRFCHLRSPQGAKESASYGIPKDESAPRLVLEGERMILTNLRAGASIAMKYLAFTGNGAYQIRVRTKGTGGQLKILADTMILSEIQIPHTKEWTVTEGSVREIPPGDYTISILCEGDDATILDLAWIEFLNLDN